MKKILLIIALWVISAGSRSFAGDIVSASRNNAVLIVAQLHTGSTEAGSGFFLDQTHVATCFHVVGFTEPTPIPGATGTDIKVANDIKVILADGETIQAQCATVPTGLAAMLCQEDFMVLKLNSVPKSRIVPCALAKDMSKQAIGSVVTFSGYPLIDESPMYKAGDYTSSFLHTFTGKLSGVSKDSKLIGIQAPVNHGSSGSAVLNEKGEVIGIITYEHSNFDGVYQQSLNVNVGTDQMTPSELKATVLIFKLIQQLSQTSSNGIGYARSISALKTYLEQHPEVMKS